MWSFSRIRDAGKIETEELSWKGPYSWPGFEEKNGLDPMPNTEGVYLQTFQYKEGYVLYSAGITNSTKQRFYAHTSSYRKGEYTVLDVNSAQKGEREEIWHGWNYAKTHQDEFRAQNETISKAVESQLNAFRIFISEIYDKRKKERIEAAIMQNIYISKEHWSELADRGMKLNGRYNSEMPIKIKNNCPNKIYGIPETLEI